MPGSIISGDLLSKFFAINSRKIFVRIPTPFLGEISGRVLNKFPGRFLGRILRRIRRIY